MEYLKGASIRYTLALLKNNRLGWKGLPRKNSVTYYECSKIMDVKSFIILGPGLGHLAFPLPTAKGAPDAGVLVLLTNVVWHPCSGQH
jgi:hypothetical protein